MHGQKLIYLLPILDVQPVHNRGRLLLNLQYGTISEGNKPAAW